MPTFQDLQNDVLQRLHQAGVSWGNAITSTSSNLVTPYWLKLEINLAYSRALSAVKDFPACLNPLQVTFPTMPGQSAWTMQPLPSQGTGVSPGNPAALQVYECKYTQASPGTPGIDRYIPFVSTDKFRRITGGYQQRFGAQNTYPIVLCQAFGRKQIEVYPATATGGQTITLTICPDPQATGRLLPSIAASAGGQLVNDTDVPLLLDEFHKVITEGAVESMARALNKLETANEALDRWNTLINEMTEYGAAQAEGDAEQQVQDTWVTMLDGDLY